MTRELGYRGPDRRRRQRRAGLGRWPRSRLASLRDLVNAMPLIRDPGQRAGLYPKVAAALERAAARTRRRAARTARAVMGRYVRIELPGRTRTLTLAEVEVFSERPQHRPRGQGLAEEHRLRRRRRAGHRRQQRAAIRRRRPDPHRGEHAGPVVGSRPRRRVSDRVPSSSTTAPTATSASGSTASRSRCSTTDRRVVFDKKKIAAPAEKGAYEVGRTTRRSCSSAARR